MQSIIILYDGSSPSIETLSILQNVLRNQVIVKSDIAISTLNSNDIAKVLAKDTVEKLLNKKKKENDSLENLDNAITFLIKAFKNENKLDGFFTSSVFDDSLTELLNNRHLPEIHKSNLIEALKTIASNTTKIKKEYIECGFNRNSVNIIKHFVQRNKL